MVNLDVKQRSSKQRAQIDIVPLQVNHITTRNLLYKYFSSISYLDAAVMYHF